MLRGKWIAVSCWHLSLPGLAASSHAQDTSRCHLPALLQKPQSCSEPELLGHLNYVQQAWSLQQRNAVLPRQPTARASASQSVLSLSSYFMWLQPLTMQAHAPHPAPTENGWHTHFRTVTDAPDSSRAGTHKQRNIFVFKLQVKHSPCQTNPAFSWILSLYPSLLSQFKLQNHHAAQVEDGVCSWSYGTTLGLHADITNTSSASEMHPSGHLCDEQPAQRPGFPCLSLFLSLCLHGCLHSQVLAGNNKNPGSKCLAGDAREVHLPRAFLEELWNWV